MLIANVSLVCIIHEYNRNAVQSNQPSDQPSNQWVKRNEQTEKRMQQLLWYLFFYLMFTQIAAQIKNRSGYKTDRNVTFVLIWMTDCLTIVDFHHWRGDQRTNVYQCDRDYYYYANAVIVIVINHNHNVQGCNKYCMTKSNTKQMPLKNSQMDNFYFNKHMICN